MKLREDQNKLKDLLKETITLLIKSGLQFKNNFSVDALIGITLDDGDGFYLSIKDSVWTNTSKLKQSRSEFKYSDEESNVTGNESDFSDSEHSYTGKNSGSVKNTSRTPRKRKIDTDSNLSHSSPSKQARNQQSGAFCQQYGLDNESNNSIIKQEPQDNREDSDLLFIKTEVPDPLSNNCIASHKFPSQSYNSFQNQHCFSGDGHSSSAGLLAWNNSNSGKPIPVTFDSSENHLIQNITGGTPSNSSLQMMTKFGEKKPVNEATSWSNPSQRKLDGLSLENVQQNVFTCNYYRRKSASLNKGIVCRICFRVFSHKRSLYDHNRGVHGIGSPFKCKCGELFLSRRTLNRHKAQCLDETHSKVELVGFDDQLVQDPGIESGETTFSDTKGNSTFEPATSTVLMPVCSKNTDDTNAMVLILPCNDEPDTTCQETQDSSQTKDNTNN